MNQTLRHLAEALAPSRGRRPHGHALTHQQPPTVLPTVSHARGLSPTASAHVLAGHLIDVVSRSGGAPGTPGAWITPPAAPTPGTLTLKGGFTVLDTQQRRLHRHAHAQGSSDLASYLQARAQQRVSPAQLASELGTTPTVVRHLLDTAGITPHPAG